MPTIATHLRFLDICWHELWSRLMSAASYFRLGAMWGWVLCDISRNPVSYFVLLFILSPFPCVTALLHAFCPSLLFLRLFFACADIHPIFSLLKSTTFFTIVFSH